MRTGLLSLGLTCVLMAAISSPKSIDQGPSSAEPPGDTVGPSTHSLRGHKTPLDGGVTKASSGEKNWKYPKTKNKNGDKYDNSGPLGSVVDHLETGGQGLDLNQSTTQGQFSRPRRDTPKQNTEVLFDTSPESFAKDQVRPRSISSEQDSKYYYQGQDLSTEKDFNTREGYGGGGGGYGGGGGGYGGGGGGYGGGGHGGGGGGYGGGGHGGGGYVPAPAPPPPPQPIIIKSPAPAPMPDMALPLALLGLGLGLGFLLGEAASDSETDGGGDRAGRMSENSDEASSLLSNIVKRMKRQTSWDEVTGQLNHLWRLHGDTSETTCVHSHLCDVMANTTAQHLTGKDCSLPLLMASVGKLMSVMSSGQLGDNVTQATSLG